MNAVAIALVNLLLGDVVRAFDVGALRVALGAHVGNVEGGNGGLRVLEGQDVVGPVAILAVRGLGVSGLDALSVGAGPIGGDRGAVGLRGR